MPPFYNAIFSRKQDQFFGINFEINFLSDVKFAEMAASDSILRNFFGRLQSEICKMNDKIF